MSRESWIHDILSGRRRGLAPTLLRFAARCAEPLYSSAMTTRNTLYNTSLLPSHALPVPVISVGNITVGGTGKTPIVLWLAQRLRESGLRPAILLRGYKRTASHISDEEELLRHELNDDGASPSIIVHADPDRVAGGKHVLHHHPDINLFILDDGFQHRRLRRQFDLVLIDALNPFGYGHVHPRGLLREPLRGLRRADAFILTRSDQAAKDERQRIASILRMHNPTAPLYEARHTHTGLKTPDNTPLPLAHLNDKRFFAFAGIANPLALQQQLPHLPGQCTGHHWFPDHHPYTNHDLLTLRERAAAAGADLLLTTEKDWPKLRALPASKSSPLPIHRLTLQIHFDPPAESGLLQLIRARIEPKPNENELTRPSRP